MSGFQRAIVGQTKARVAFYGVGGSGKTTHALTLARVLAGVDGTIALLDTEGGSSSKYADAFAFDMQVLRPPFHPKRFVVELEGAAAAGYAVFVADGISPFWSGAGGVQSIVDTSPKKWAEGTPAHQSLVNAILLSPIHVVLTVRAKGETLVDKDERGKVQIRKIGLKPDTRDGLEYEVDALLYCDVADNSVTSEKTRIRGQMGMKLPADRVLEWCEGYKAWIESGAPALAEPAPPAPAEAPQTPPPAAAATGDPTGGLAPAAPAPAAPAPAAQPETTPARVAIRDRIKATLAALKELDANTDWAALVAQKIPEWFPGKSREAELDDAQADEAASKIEATLTMLRNRASA